MAKTHGGEDSDVRECGNSRFAVGFSVKEGSPLKRPDDRHGLTGIRLHCQGGGSQTSSHISDLGTWNTVGGGCARGYIGADVRIVEHQGVKHGFVSSAFARMSSFVTLTGRR